MDSLPVDGAPELQGEHAPMDTTPAQHGEQDIGIPTSTDTPAEAQLAAAAAPSRPILHPPQKPNSCIVCATDNPSYKCTKCKFKFCSVDCSKSHRKWHEDNVGFVVYGEEGETREGKEMDDGTSTPGIQQQNGTSTRRTTGTDNDDDTTVLPQETLSLLESNSTIRHLCESETFRNTLLALDDPNLSDSRKEKMLLTLLNTNNEFALFANESYRTVTPSNAQTQMELQESQNRLNIPNYEQLKKFRKYILDQNAATDNDDL